ncbi:hypothetical protein HYT57_05410 [Candidatus Woesearchaeota archaeon]|nr:hypothetical protein [Candidatus Woesearchaeota archaeon]
MRQLSKIFGLVTILATASCSSTIDPVSLFRNFRELSEKQQPKRIGVQNRTFALPDYVIELTETGGSIQYSLTYTWAQSNMQPNPIAIIAEKKIFDEIGTLTDYSYIRDGTATRNFDGIPDIGKENGINITPKEAKKIYEEITNKVLEEF